MTTDSSDDWTGKIVLLVSAGVALLVSLAIWGPSSGGPPAAPGAASAAGPLNVPLKTMGGKQVWADEKVYAGWRVQRNVLTSHWRLLDPGDVRRAWGARKACEEKLASLRGAGLIAAPSTDTVILLHGIWRAKESMHKLETALRARGYEAFSLNYPSVLDGIEEHAEQLGRVVEGLEGAERVSLVCHSMGGLVARCYLRDRRDPRIGRLIMIATPNQGSGMADRLDKAKILRPFYGPAGPQMKVGANGKTPDLGIPWCEFGVIAGGKGDGKGFNPLLEGDNDMTVEVENTKLEGMADFLLLPCLHTVIMTADETIEAVANFLATGRFRPDEPSPF